MKCSVKSLGHRSKACNAHAYLLAVRIINVLPIHVLVIGLVRQISGVSNLLLFKFPYNIRVQLGEKFTVFHQNCFTTTAISRLFQAEKENLWRGVGGDRVDLKGICHDNAHVRL